MPDLKDLIGKQWQKVYPHQDPDTDSPLHPAILQLLDHALNKVGEKLKERSSEDRSKSREEAKNALGSTPKRLRAA